MKTAIMSGLNMKGWENKHAESFTEEQGKENSDYEVYSILRNGAGKTAFCT